VTRFAHTFHQLYFCAKGDGPMRCLPVSAFLACTLFGAWSCSGGGGGGGLEANLTKPPKVTCQAGSDCDGKWGRANKWVTESSGLKIQTTTDSLITTVQSKVDSRTLVLTVAKNPTSQPGVYEISVTAGCPSMFSCLPPTAEVGARLTNFIATGQ